MMKSVLDENICGKRYQEKKTEWLGFKKDFSYYLFFSKMIIIMKKNYLVLIKEKVQ